MDTENTIHRPRAKTRPSMEVVMMRHVLMTVGALLYVGLASVQAHENRQVGGYTLTVGFRVEPAFEDVVNAIDIFVNRTSNAKGRYDLSSYEATYVFQVFNRP